MPTNPLGPTNPTPTVPVPLGVPWNDRVAQECAIRNAAAINKLLKGKHNAGSRTFTLSSGAGVRSTVFTDELVNPNSQISFHPITQDAAQEQIWIVCGMGQFTVYHTPDVGPINDRSYQYSVHG
jgi:hypothetical protein